MDRKERVRTGRRSRWSRGIAAVLLAVLASSFAPRPAEAAEHRCHAPAPQHLVTAAHDGCGQCAQGTCVAMPGCGHVVAVATTPAPAPSSASDYSLTEPETSMVRDLAPRGPPTPPPNS